MLSRIVTAGSVHDNLLRRYQVKSLCVCVAITCFGNSAKCQQCDFDADGDCDVADIDQMSLVPPVDLRFDLNDDGIVDNSDIDSWLSLAGTENGFREPLLRGDANLDGKVDALDLNQLGIHWQIMEGMVWSQGDFDGDARVTAADLMHLGLNWRQEVPLAAVSVPEPTSYLLVVLGAWGLFRLVRRCPASALVAVLVSVCLWRN